MPRPLRPLLALVAVLLGAATPALAQTGKITVTDAETGETLPGVNVVIEGTTQGASTDLDGQYTIIGVRPDAYAVVFSYIGYRQQRVEEVRVWIDLTTTLDAALAPDAVEGDEVVVRADRQLFQRDVTATTATVSGDEIRDLPVENFGDVIALQAGVVSTGGNVHFRGGQTPTVVEISTVAGQADRWIRLEKDGLQVVVVGNFRLTERTSTPPLAAGQTWYDMIGDGQAAGGSAVTLAPGAWRVYANQDLGVPVASEETPGETAAAFGLNAPFPNPFAGPAAVTFTLPSAGDARLDAFDVLGRRVATLAEGAHAAGRYRASFDPAGLPAGVYVLRLVAGAQTATARVTVAR